jgi:hypothetical protein
MHLQGLLDHQKQPRMNTDEDPSTAIAEVLTDPAGMSATSDVFYKASG